MSQRVMGTVDVSGDNQVTVVRCNKCDADKTFVRVIGGAWEIGKHWAIAHECKVTP